jgi:hypothetical protein
MNSGFPQLRRDRLRWARHAGAVILGGASLLGAAAGAAPGEAIASCADAKVMVDGFPLDDGAVKEKVCRYGSDALGHGSLSGSNTAETDSSNQDGKGTAAGSPGAGTTSPNSTSSGESSDWHKKMQEGLCNVAGGMTCAVKAKTPAGVVACGLLVFVVCSNPPPPSGRKVERRERPIWHFQ